ncbi:MAG: hypothetical protein QQW96_25570 [Tychonema bourrellyi B0820]|uniref:Uncharacterized protein n=1 Tax=Microcoleus anatoxicus PTRS2 TaxID=2705321 RepID=A0ABU8YN46_9CYAN|nr:hypothetical protein [Tychonema bourrellyi B0820]
MQFSWKIVLGELGMVRSRCAEYPSEYVDIFFTRHTNFLQIHLRI